MTRWAGVIPQAQALVSLEALPQARRPPPDAA